MKFYKCNICKRVSTRKEICCGNEMEELIPNSVNAIVEKHVPIIFKDEEKVEVKVGEAKHPMSEEHYIEFIYLETNKNQYKKTLSVNDEPIAYFTLEKDEIVINAYAYCNLHGLWISK